MPETQLPLTVQSNWQDSIDQQLQQRLMRPLVQPGITNTTQLARAIMSRSQRFGDRLPLLAQINQRMSSVRTQTANDLPLVYAQSLPSQNNTVNTAIAPGSSRTNLQLVYAHSLPVPDNTGEEFNLSETSSVPNKQQQEIPIVQAKFVSNGKANFVDKSRRSDLLTGMGNEREVKSLIYIDSGSRDLNNILQPNDLSESVNLTSTLDLSKISGNELPVVQAKVDSAIQSADLLSPSLPEKSADNEHWESRLPLVKVTPELISEPTLRTAPLLNQITVGHELRTEIDNSTGKDLSHVTQFPSLLLKNAGNSLTEIYDKPRRALQLLVRQNLVSSWKGLDTQLLLSVPPLTSHKTVATNGKQDAITNNLAEKLESRKPTEVAIARTATNNNSENTLPNSPAISAVQTESSSLAQISSAPQIYLDSLADKVERKLMRRIAIESERRGQKRWR